MLPDGKTVADMGGVWHVAVVRHRHEKAYVHDLLRIAEYTGEPIGFFLPLDVYRVRRPNRAWALRHVPMFHRTIFVNAPENCGVEIDPNRRVCNVVRVAKSSQPRLREDLSRVEIAVLSDPSRINPYPFAEPGRMVRVLNGPFQGKEGPVVYADGGRRKFIIQIECLGDSRSYELEPHIEIEPVD